ncbi:DMT family transporter [Luteimonas yindakuii]|uniref:DMT family transporter n=1 Tax=Luteimonas yindakuii TaxID=2565782 RepID=A0A4Z1R179_9GAMM|nr:DMT family transporter [Luteimonas yindakuii]TKS53404.1 DMT family transporter [Luteimonas yindakuii]
MTPLRLVLSTALVLLAFAGNSLLCRWALQGGRIDPAGFTAIRLASGALVLWLLVRMRGGAHARTGGSWGSALALFAYAAAFSYAFMHVPVSTGTLLLFAAVQATMVGAALWTGERLSRLQWAGFVLALAGLVAMLLPGLSAPAPVGAALMLAAGIAWGCYSLRGRRSRDPLTDTAGNFMRALPFGSVLLLATADSLHADTGGVALAVLSGAVTSGLGYALWYAVLPSLGAARAAGVQLGVPPAAAVAGVLVLGEVVDARLLLASAMILGGIAMVSLRPRPA